jgi:uncharacterized protein (DUF58 family)
MAGQEQRADLLDPATIASLGRVEIIARWIVDGFLTGHHRSPRRGFSVEFAEHRPYQPGDDLRSIDWKIAARADRWVVKQFEEETNLRAFIVLDVSRSMDWSGARPRGHDGHAPAPRLTKRQYADRLAAAVALLLLRQHDAVGLVRFDAVVRSLVPPRARRGQWRRLVSALNEGGSGLDSAASGALDQAARLIRGRGMVVLISDLLIDVMATERTVRTLRALGHDVTVLHVMDRAERELMLSGSGDVTFMDPESGVEVPAAVSDVRAAYRATVDQVIEEWRTTLAGAGAGYDLVLTDAPFGVPLRRAFASRQQLP